MKSFGLLVLKDLNQSKRLNISSLAKRASVSRPWVYKYFGSTPDEIAINVVDSIAPLISEIDEPVRRPNTREEWLQQTREAFSKTLNEVETFPEAIEFYIRSFLSNSKFAEQIENHEFRFQENRVLPTLTTLFKLEKKQAQASAEALHLLRLGTLLKWMRERDRSPQKRQVFANQLAEAAMALMERPNERMNARGFATSN